MATTKKPGIYDDQIGLLNPLINVDRRVRGAVDGVLGGGALLGGVGLQGMRQIGTAALGGDPSTLTPNAMTQWGRGRMDASQELLVGRPGRDAAQIAGAAQGAGLNFLGAAPANAGEAPAAAAPAPQPLVGQGRNMGRAMPPGMPVPAAPARDYDAEVAAAMQPAPQQAPGVVPQRGVYNEQTVDRNALSARTAPSNGINFGFGGNNETARGYLDRMDAKDQDNRMAGQRRMLEAEMAKLSSGQSIGETVATRSRIKAMQTNIAQQEGTQVERERTAAGLTAEQTRGQFGLQGTQITADASRDNSLASAAATQDAATTRAQAALEAAQLNGRARIGAAEVAANGRAGGDYRDQMQGEMYSLRIENAIAAAARGDKAELRAMLIGASPQQQELIQNMMGTPIGEYGPGGAVPYSPELVDLFNANSGLKR